MTVIVATTTTMATQQSIGKRIGDGRVTATTDDNDNDENGDGNDDDEENDGSGDEGGGVDGDDDSDDDHDDNNDGCKTTINQKTEEEKGW